MAAEQQYELFITEHESLVLEALVKLEAPHSQRAQALLAVDAGSTLEQASHGSGLRVTQVKFWLGRFANSRLEIFPESLLADIENVLRGEEPYRTGDGDAGAPMKVFKKKKKDPGKKPDKAKEKAGKKKKGKKGKKAGKIVKKGKALKKGGKKKNKAAKKKSSKKSKKKSQK